MDLPPISASLGAMGSLARKLNALLDAEFKNQFGKVTTRLDQLSKARDPPAAAGIWMKDVRELSYDMENCVDIGERGWIDRKSGFKARVKEANKQYDKYMLGNIPVCTDVFLIIDHRLPTVDGGRKTDPVIIGLHGKGGAVDDLRPWLTDDGVKEELKVVSIVGARGIGKTTLAKQLWRDNKLGEFRCRAFVRTAKKPDMRRTLRSILAQVRPHQPPDSNEVHELIQDIREHLRHKRYLIIIDDLWATSVWDVARRAFPGGNGSRILTTTEFENVATACCRYEIGYVYHMKPLSISHSIELFGSGMFGSGEEKSRQLVEVTEEIIRRCDGLPLAIISISSVIASQGKANTVHNREQIQNSLPTNTTPDDILKQVLNCCYYCLPSCLQSCLLYLSLYPENYVILKEDIMKQWVAEGFILAPTENNKMKVAGNYFDKLVDMGMIQQIDVDYNDEVLYYAVHRTVHELITSKSIEENFVTVIDYSQRKVRFSNKVGRLSLQFGSATYATTPESIGLSHVRSLCFIGLESCFPPISEFKLLRCLILHMWADQPRTGVDLKCTSELVLLRSLQVTCNNTVHLPDLMQGPVHLETLEINARVSAIPANIVHLRSWLHLRLGVGTELPDLTGILKNVTMNPPISLDESSRPPNSVMTINLLSPISRMPKWIGQLTNLSILKFVISELQRDDISNLQELTVLTVLCLHVQRRTAELSFATGKFKTLEYFEFRCGVLSLDFEKGAMPNLQRVKLGFNAQRRQQYRRFLAGMKDMLSIQKISVLIGSAADAEENDLDAAESAIKVAIGRHYSKASIKRSGMIEEQSDEHPSTSGEQEESIQELHMPTPNEGRRIESHKEIKEDFGTYPQPESFSRSPAPSAASKNNNYSGPQQSAERPMADLAFGFTIAVVEGSLSKAQAAIEKEAKLPPRAQSDLVFITDELQMIHSVLKLKAENDHVENTLVRHARELAYDLDDCIEFVIHLDKKSIWLWRAAPSWCTPVELPLDTAVDEIKMLKEMVLNMRSMIERYSYSLVSYTRSKPIVQHEPSPTTSAVSMLIGTGGRQQQGDLTQLLANDKIHVISVWGTGGDLGVTSNIWKVYNDQKTSQRFTCRAWVKLMHPFNPHEFIGCLAAQFYADEREEQDGEIIAVDVLTRMPETEFVQRVNNEKSLVVLEGLYTMTDWAAIRKVFPERKNGSCIIVSTQQSEIASLSVGQPYKVLELNKLSVDHTVYAFYKESSQFDGDKGGETAVDIKKAAQEWMAKHRLFGRDSEMYDLRQYTTKARLGIQVMSVWGIAGVGKSALLRNLFYDIILNDYELLEKNKPNLFEKYAWVDVSYPFNLRQFSRSILLNFQSQFIQAHKDHYVDAEERGNPIVECRKILQQQRCLIVIDDLQSTIEWDFIQAELLSRSSHNCIIIITTEASIAKHCRGNKGELVFNVKGLQANAALDLFKNEVSSKHPLPPGLTQTEDGELQELISMCGGLPRVIVEIASSLSARQMEGARSISEKFMHDLENNQEFDSLHGQFSWMRNHFRTCPDSLKPCIFYLSIFPRNHITRRRRLVRRWIAEGYSRDNHEESAEQNGEKQFSDLLNLSIIQQPPTTVGNERTVLCQVNGFIREYIVSRRMGKNIVFELGDKCAPTTQRTGRHLVILKNWDRDRIAYDSIDFSRLSSLTVFGKWESFFISRSMKLLRVLDLEDASGVIEYEDLENMVKCLRRLKFLSLRGQREIHRLPSSLDHLRQLQTLDVRGTSIMSLPENITKLQKLQYIRAGTTNVAATTPLRHVSSSWFGRRRHGLVGVDVPGGIGTLTALLTLGVVNVAASGAKATLREIKKLTQLRKLGVSGINRKNNTGFFTAIKGHVQLESLSVQLDKESQGCCLDDMISLPLENLQSLKLYGLDDKLPEWRSDQLSKLRKLGLEMATFMEGDIKSVGYLPQLSILRFKQLNDGELQFRVTVNGEEDHSYEMVKVLEIACGNSSSRLNVNFGSKTMEKLELLKIDCCGGSPSYQFSGLENLIQLKEVWLVNGSNVKALKEQLHRQLKEHQNKRLVVKLEQSSL